MEKSFEESVKRLEEIVSSLESGKLSLEESLKLYEEGTLLAGACGKYLDAAEQKITELNSNKQEQ